jgi:hypothetical protein
MAKGFTKTNFMDLWNDELLPSIHKLIKTENKQIHDEISDMNMPFKKLEESQQFLS